MCFMLVQVADARQHARKLDDVVSLGVSVQQMEYSIERHNVVNVHAEIPFAIMRMAKRRMIDRRALPR